MHVTPYNTPHTKQAKTNESGFAEYSQAKRTSLSQNTSYGYQQLHITRHTIPTALLTARAASLGIGLVKFA